MSNYIRAKATGAYYFFTIVSYQRQPILCQPHIRQALRAAIRQVQIEQPFEIKAIVLLPNHLHTIFKLPENDADFSKRIGKLKSYTSKSCRDFLMQRQSNKRELTLWQRRFWEHQIRDEADYIAHCDYIHYNPVKHGLVQNVADWEYSSFHRFVKQGLYPANWGQGMTLPERDFGEP